LAQRLKLTIDRSGVEIELSEFERNGAKFNQFLKTGRFDDLANALAGIEATFSVQDRRVLGVGLGL
jgi:hypothetical protein